MKINHPPHDAPIIPCIAGHLIGSEARVWRYGDRIRLRAGCMNLELEPQHALRLAYCLQQAADQIIASDCEAPLPAQFSLES